MFNAVPEEYKLVIIVVVLGVLCFMVIKNNSRNQSKLRGRRGRDFKTNYYQRKKEDKENKP